MAEEPVADGGQGEDPARGPAPGGPGPGPGAARGFASGGPLDQAFPSAALTTALDRASGPGRCCENATDDEVFGQLGRWDASEAWCASAKLGVIRALIRRRALPGYPLRPPGGLPSAWQAWLGQEVSEQLGISVRAADALIELAWTLEARLVLTAVALDAGIISLTKARIIADATSVLDDERAAAAETLVAGDLAGKTPGQVAAMIARAVVKVDPEGARKRREQAQRKEARVRFWREHAGTAALAAFGLPPDEALAANQHIQDTALAYRAAGMPGTLDQLRVRAFLDAINGTDSRPPASAQPPASKPPANAAPSDERPPATAAPGDAAPGDDSSATEASSSGAEPPGNGTEPPGNGTEPPGNGTEPPGNGTEPPGNGTEPPGNGTEEPRDTPRQETDGTDGTDGTAGTGNGVAGLAANTMLTIPLATVLGLADNPGEAHGLGVIDPALARQMAAAAARNPRSTWCVTVTNDRGHAIAHGCAKPMRNPSRHSQNYDRDGPSFTKVSDRGPPGGHGTWRLTIGGRRYTVTLIPIPVTDCDHRYESAGYQPSALLRHLVQVRDGQCTQPTCVRSARRCDFEHAQPWHKGGRTCACNAGCRCRRDHKIKQSRGWKVTQPMPGYHQWTTPSGRTYTKEPMRYPI
jgi:hypothetical protein